MSELLPKLQEELKVYKQQLQQQTELVHSSTANVQQLNGAIYVVNKLINELMPKPGEPESTETVAEEVKPEGINSEDC